MYKINFKIDIDNKMQRDNTVDIAKGVGIFLVVWLHQIANCPIMFWILLFAMPLFFYLGGCFIKNEKYSIFLYKKIRTLLVPFLFFYLSSLILKIIIYRFRTENFSFIQDMKFYAITSINYPLWFIVCLFVSLNIYYFIRKSKYPFFFIVAVSILGGLLYYYKFHLPLFISQSFLAIPFIYLGEKTYKSTNGFLIFIALLTLPIFIYAGLNNIVTDMAILVVDKNILLFFLPAFCGIGLTLLFSRLIKNYKVSFPLQIMGRYSLFIFALHANNSFLHPICNQIVKFVPLHLWLGFKNIYVGLVNTIIVIIFSLIVGLLLKRYFSIFFGYRPNDRILLILNAKFQSRNQEKN